jgi:hypothetical protein
MASITPRDVAQKIGGNGTKTPADIAKQLNDKTGKPLDIGRTKTSLEQSGNALPPLKKGK